MKFLIKNSVALGIGSLFASFFSYLLQLYLGKYLTLQDFGSFTALLSISYVFTALGSVFALSLTKMISQIFQDSQDPSKPATLFWGISYYSVFVAILIFIVNAIVSTFISDQLKIYDVTAVVLFGAVISLSFFSQIPSSFFQGFQKYGFLSLYNSFSSLFRLAIPSFMVLLGFGLSGVYFGMFSGILVSYALALPFIKLPFTPFWKEKNLDQYKSLLHLSVPVLFSMILLTLLNNQDILLVKKFFDPETAGYYSGMIVLGKILLFGAGIVTTLMFPTITSLHSKKESYQREFWIFLGLQALMVLVGTIIYALFPVFITKLFFQDKFLYSAQYLPIFSLFIGLYIMINFLVLYCLATDKNKVYWLLIPGIITQLISILLNHQTLYNVIRADILASLISLVLLIVYLFGTPRSFAKEN